ncbi:MAG: hypothetical protein ABJK28_13340 [Algibacter sp.]
MKYINYILILVGAFIAMYAKAGADQNQALLVIGIVMLMLGVYRVSRMIPSKNKEEEGVEDSENQ